jgi:hypothetical protein
MIGPMRLPLINWMAPPADAPRAPFLRLSTRWIQITGTWCNLECVHCINANGPADPWLRPETLARQMEQDGQPPEFAETVRTGWWTTCLENPPSKERSRGKF